MIFDILKNERFSVVFPSLMLFLSGVSLYVDFSASNDVYWFQRSGALIVLAGLSLQYAKLVALWKKALERETAVEPVESRVTSGQGIGLIQTAKESEATLAFAIRIHDIVTEKSAKDVIAIFHIVVGTTMWGYSDLPFKRQGPTTHSTGPAAKSAAGPVNSNVKSAFERPV
jgi:hypothetical protein